MIIQARNKSFYVIHDEALDQMTDDRCIHDDFLLRAIYDNADNFTGLCVHKLCELDSSKLEKVQYHDHDDAVIVDGVTYDVDLYNGKFDEINAYQSGSLTLKDGSSVRMIVGFKMDHDLDSVDYLVCELDTDQIYIER